MSWEAIEQAARANCGSCIGCADVAKVGSRLCGACEERRRQMVEALKYKTKAQRMMLEIKSKPCIDCGIQYPPQCMDMDHSRGGREFGISTKSFRFRGVAATLAEAEKCDLRCPTCHRLRHYWVNRPDDPFFVTHPPYPSWGAATYPERSPRQESGQVGTPGEGG